MKSLARAFSPRKSPGKGPSAAEDAVVCAYILSGDEWTPVKGDAVDESASRFLAARVAAADAGADAAPFVELRGYPETAVLEFAVRVGPATTLRRLSDASDERTHLYEVAAPAGPDVVALQFADRPKAEAFGRSLAAAAREAASRSRELKDAAELLRKCVAAGYRAADVREAQRCGATSRVQVANFIFDREKRGKAAAEATLKTPEARPRLDEAQLRRFEDMGFKSEEAKEALEEHGNDERKALRRLLVTAAAPDDARPPLRQESSLASSAASLGDSRTAPAEAAPASRSGSLEGKAEAKSPAKSPATSPAKSPARPTTVDTQRSGSSDECRTEPPSWATSAGASAPSLSSLGRTPVRKSRSSTDLPAVTEEGPSPKDGASKGPVARPPAPKPNLKPKRGLAGRLLSMVRPPAPGLPRPSLPRGTSARTSALRELSQAAATVTESRRNNAAVGFSDFDALKVLGVGGFGTVLLVRKRAGLRAGELFAAKVMKKATYAGRLSEHAFMERNLMLVARHPFLVRLRYAFQSRHDLYLVTDYFAGGSLEDSLKRANKKGLGRDAARMIIAELALGLDYLHARDVLHRDIKAANVLLDIDGHAHLCDFGLAKCVEGDWRSGPRKSFAGTVEYMAPELLSKGADAPSPALDWWALGVLLVETVQGRTPFRARTPRQLMLNIIRGPPQIDDPDPGLLSVAEKLLQKKPGRRLRGAEHLAKRRFFEAVDFSTLELKQHRQPFRPQPTSFSGTADPKLEETYGGGDEHPSLHEHERPSLAFKGEQFTGFSVFASPPPPQSRKRSA